MRNAVAGDKDNAEIVFFDCTIGAGKRRVVRTVVAVRGPNKGFGSARLDPGLTTERVDDWMLIYTYRKELLPEEIEALLSSIQLLAM
jgi:hypothetical protein